MSLSDRLRGLAATAAIAALLVGLPWLLLQLGLPAWPDRLTWADVGRFLTSPDDGTLALAVLKLIGWITWAVLVVLILIEIAAALRRIEPPQLHPLARPQHWARSLVATAALLFIATGQTSPTPAFAVNPAAPITAVPTSHSDAARQDATTQKASTTQDATGTVRYTVRPGDSLWRISHERLGDGSRYREIVALNPDLLHHGADFLRPGWVLTLPADADTVIVRAGDTLSALARSHFGGDESKAAQIFDASRGLTQSDGRHLADPDLIYPGWHLHLTPAAAGNTEPDAAAAPAGSQAETAEAPATAAAQTQAGTGEQTQPAAAASTTQAVGSETTSGIPRAASPSATSAAGAAPYQADESPEASQQRPSWLLLGLTGGGIILAGAMYRALKQRRAAQFRARRPGRTINPVPHDVIAVEKTLLSIGTAAAPTVEALDAVLGNLALAIAEAVGDGLLITAAALAPSAVQLHLAEPADLPAPWHPDDSRVRWRLDAADLPAAAAGATPHLAPPYPQLFTLGQADDGTIWLFNAEQAGVLALTGDDVYAMDFTRSLVAEFTLSPWTRDLTIDCLQLGRELDGLHPEKLTIHDENGCTAAVTDTLQHARTTLADMEAQHLHSLAHARVTAVGESLWESRVVIAGPPAHAAAAELAHLVATHPRRSATGVVLVGATASDPEAVELRFTAEGRLQVPSLGLDLIAAGLTSAEAEASAILLLACEELTDAPVPAMPPAETKDWHSTCDQAGHLLADLTLARQPDPQDDSDDIGDAEHAESLLPASDRDYLERGATTVEDLGTLAPRVTEEVRDEVARLDPSLDADVAAWFADTCPRPRLTVLGPVQLRIGAGGKPSAGVRRKPFLVEMAAYLAMHPDGVTTSQLAEAMGSQPDRIRKDVSVLREWLGADPASGRLHVPDALRSTAAHQRGGRLYQLDGVLVDADLFRRLRVRGESRGADGITDLRLALRLVHGQPFKQMRSTGGTWLAGEQRHDHYLAAGIVDAAHLVAVDAIHAGDYPGARAAAEIAAVAAPYDEIPNLDLVAIATAEGRFNEADRILRYDVCNRSDDGGAPTDLSERTSRIINSHSWPSRRWAAG